jgi:hypothetical protein
MLLKEVDYMIEFQTEATNTKRFGLEARFNCEGSKVLLPE